MNWVIDLPLKSIYFINDASHELSLKSIYFINDASHELSGRFAFTVYKVRLPICLTTQPVGFCLWSVHIVVAGGIILFHICKMQDIRIFFCKVKDSTLRVEKLDVKSANNNC